MEQLCLLYIEDDEMIARTTRDGASEQGVEMELAHSGEKGLLRAGSGEFDVIILDRMRPDLDGIKIVTRRHEDPKFRSSKCPLALDSFTNARGCITILRRS
jgi:DNA-binding response OmpR family regulator